MKPPTSSLKTWAAIIVAAGKSKRLKSPVPKPFLRVDGQKTMLDLCLKSFRKAGGLGSVVVVTQPAYLERAAQAIQRAGLRGLAVEGGKEREDSVLRGLLVLPPALKYVLVHDAARPLVKPAVIQRVLKALRGWGAVIPAVPVADTLKAVSGSRVVKTLDRSALRAVQTPQGFRLPLLRKAFWKGGPQGSRLTDDAAVAEAAGYSVHVVEGDSLNFKVTTPEDLQRLRNIVRNGS